MGPLYTMVKFENTNSNQRGSRAETAETQVWPRASGSSLYTWGGSARISEALC